MEIANLTSNITITGNIDMKDGLDNLVTDSDKIDLNNAVENTQVGIGVEIKF